MALTPTEHMAIEVATEIIAGRADNVIDAVSSAIRQRREIILMEKEIHARINVKVGDRVRLSGLSNGLLNGATGVYRSQRGKYMDVMLDERCRRGKFARAPLVGVPACCVEKIADGAGAGMVLGVEVPCPNMAPVDEEELQVA